MYPVYAGGDDTTPHTLVSQGKQVNSHLRVQLSSQAPTDSEFQAGLGRGLSLLPQPVAQGLRTLLPRSPTEKARLLRVDTHVYVHS